MVESQAVPFEEVGGGLPLGVGRIGAGSWCGQVGGQCQVGHGDNAHPGVAMWSAEGRQLLQVRLLAGERCLLLQLA